MQASLHYKAVKYDKAGLDVQKMKSILLLDNVATLVHFLFAQTKLIPGPVKHV